VNSSLVEIRVKRLGGAGVIVAPAGRPVGRIAPVTEELRRAFQLIASGDMGGERTQAARFGLAVFDPRVPLRYDSNYLLVDELPASVSAGALAAEARRLDRPSIMVRHQPTGERLAPGFAALGWLLHRGLVMAHRRPPDRTAPAGLVSEVDEAALRPARRQQLAGYPWATPAVTEQLLDAKLLIAQAVRARFFAVVRDGQVVAYADLYDDGRTAQIEDVATLDEHRGRGYASALVRRAVDEARQSGCDLVFLVSDEDDWPQALYRRLGFDDLGRYLKFMRPD
jgi:ribosomal protein S18 acetylase RimI-like enzyme/antitoxin (DNA-binding transcriptional repressor) of toxin-antitoxin stability system